MFKLRSPGGTDHKFEEWQSRVCRKRRNRVPDTLWDRCVFNNGKKFGRHLKVWETKPSILKEVGTFEKAQDLDLLRGYIWIEFIDKEIFQKGTTIRRKTKVGRNVFVE